MPPIRPFRSCYLGYGLQASLRGGNHTETAVKLVSCGKLVAILQRQDFVDSSTPNLRSRLSTSLPIYSDYLDEFQAGLRGRVAMPHATMPHTGFQALILCGPGEGLNPFNANPKDYPKALIPIANRPMVWYPLDWCYRAGVTNITLITPPECHSALSNALSQNPYLTSLPTPKPTLLAPSNLTLTTGTADIIRLQEVQDALVGDFIVLPCDLVCELPGLELLETWMTLQGPLDGGEADLDNSGRRGGLGVWYQTKDADIEGSIAVKGEETDFIAVVGSSTGYTSLPRSNGLISRTSELALSMPTAELQDLAEQSQNMLHIRRAALRKHGSVKILTTYRDAHLYFFPAWVKDFIKRNENFESIGEDVVGWWAKSGWQEGLSDKLQINQSKKRQRRKSEAIEEQNTEDEIDMSSLVSTGSRFIGPQHSQKSHGASTFASRVKTSTMTPSGSNSSELNGNGMSNNSNPSSTPRFLAYTHSTIIPPISATSSSLSAPESMHVIRRIDTAALLLTSSLYLARLPPSSDSSHPYSHAVKIHQTTKQPERATITGSTTLIDANCTLAEKITLKDSVVGASCTIETMCRINRSVVMDGTIVGERATLTGCVIGRRARVEAGCDLKDCQVSDGFIVPSGTTAKGEVFAGFDEGDGSVSDDSEIATGQDLR